jgi:hypothetical protein
VTAGSAGGPQIANFAGERMFVDYAGTTLEVVDGTTGEVPDNIVSLDIRKALKVPRVQVQ